LSDSLTEAGEAPALLLCPVELQPATRAKPAIARTMDLAI